VAGNEGHATADMANARIVTREQNHPTRPALGDLDLSDDDADGSVVFTKDVELRLIQVRSTLNSTTLVKRLLVTFDIGSRRLTEPECRAQ
jgi:hypothetical protein